LPYLNAFVSRFGEAFIQIHSPSVYLDKTPGKAAVERFA
jgi:hypothetical protein